MGNKEFEFIPAMFNEEEGESSERIAQKKQVREIYSDIIKLLSEYSSSQCYNNAPDGSDPLVYYRGRVDEIEVKVNQIYGNSALVKFLLFIIRPLKDGICQCNLVLKRWFSVNPNLRFYAAPFDVMIESPETYRKIIKGESCITLDFYPDYEDLIEYCRYFRRIYHQNKENNYHYTKEELFQKEMILAATILFNVFVYRFISK